MFDFGKLKGKTFDGKFEMVEPECFRHAGQAKEQHEITDAGNPEAALLFNFALTDNKYQEFDYKGLAKTQTFLCIA